MRAAGRCSWQDVTLARLVRCRGNQASVIFREAMRHSVRLRPWQKRALSLLAERADPDFLAVATPGAGKTTFALTAAITALQEAPDRRVLVVAPTQALKSQWARAAGDLGLHLEPSWAGRDGGLPADMHGAVVTYQQVAADPTSVAKLAHGSFAVFDELHHAGEERAWGDALRLAFDTAARRLALSGTPFRSDTHAIPFVRYDADEASPDFVYGYGDALAEGGVVRPVFFPRVDGQMEWTAPDGTRHGHTFSDPLDRVRAGQRLRTALSVDGDWLPAVLSRAHATLTEIRRTDPAAGGLVIAADQEHAHAIASLLRDRVGVSPAVAVSEDPLAPARITRFAADRTPWIVAVRMVSEGVDIPRLRVGVFATTTVTELFFRQAVGRLVRYQPGITDQRAHLFIPDDVRLRTFAAEIADERRHRLVRAEPDEREAQEEDVYEEPAEQGLAVGDEGQLSLFAPISAVALDEAGPVTPAPDAAPPPGGPDDPSLLVDLFPPPRGQQAEDAAGGVARGDHKRALRDQNAAKASELARLTGLSHRRVNSELNKLAGLRRVSDATAAQLRARIDQADRWLRRL